MTNRKITKSTKPPKKKKKQKRGKRKPRRVEAYTFGEAERTKDWPFGKGKLGA